jgi:hypothetical protein
MQQTDTANTVFQQAVAFVNQTNQHLFLTGKAGTGKTTFLRYIRDNCYKKMAVVAPTGVAAINAGGVTIHSFFQLPFGTFLPTQRTVWGNESQNVYNKNQLLGKLRLNSTKRDLIRELDLLVIDEISMVRADVLDAIDAVLRSVRRRPHDPFGGVQMLFIGDMFQLPPVVREEEWQLMSEHYNSPFFFDSLVVKEAMPVYIELKKIYRQSDGEFISLLNNIRNNNCTEEDLERLQMHYDPFFSPLRDDGFITLTSHNYKADAINQEELDKLPGKTHKIEAVINNEFPEHAYPVDKVLNLKEGAQVMFIKNDKGDTRRYYNGKIGRIESIDEFEKKILVSFPNETARMQLELEVWKNIRYRYNNEDDDVQEEELGNFQQYPIRLAWAVTIHKSQGLTFERAIVDAGQSFAAGQVYVALSRLTNLDGLVLKSRIQASSIMTDERILDFSRNEEPEEQVQRTLELSQQYFTEQSLLLAYDWEKVLDIMNEHLESYSSSALPDKAEATDWARGLARTVEKQYHTALKFVPQLEELLKTGKAGYDKLHERTKAASSWFINDLEDQVIAKIKAQIVTEKVKTRTKKYVKALQELMLAFERKKLQVMQTAGITEALSQSLKMHEIMERVSRLHAPIEIILPQETLVKTVVGDSKKISLEMFQAGRSIAEIAAERGMVKGTIEGHLAEFIATGEIDISLLVPDHKLKPILQLLKDNPDATSGMIKEKLDSSFSFGEIKAAMAFQRKGK